MGPMADGHLGELRPGATLAETLRAAGFSPGRPPAPRVHGPSPSSSMFAVWPLVRFTSRSTPVPADEIAALTEGARLALVRGNADHVPRWRWTRSHGR